MTVELNIAAQNYPEMLWQKQAYGCFWLCSACTKSETKVLSVNKLEIAKEEIKASINELKDESIPLISTDPPVYPHANNYNIHYPKQHSSLEIKIAGIGENHSKDKIEKVGPLQRGNMIKKKKF